MVSVKGPRESRSSPTNLCDALNKASRETLRDAQVTAVLWDPNFFQIFAWKGHFKLITFYLKA